MKIVVIGGTGLIGSRVVQKLVAQGHQAVAAAPSTGVDTISGEGLGKALAGAEVVVDVSNAPSFEDKAAMDFFQTSAWNLTLAEVTAGVGHHVALSVVGTERLQESGYFRAKLAQEGEIRRSPIPYTLVRATQFFEFLRGIAQSATVGRAVRLPHISFQPMAAEDVASAIAAAALAPAPRGTIEIAGPDRYFIDELVGSVLAYDGDPREVIADPEARYFGARLEEDWLLPEGNAQLGSTGFEGWLTQVPPRPKEEPLAVPLESVQRC